MRCAANDRIVSYKTEVGTIGYLQNSPRAANIDDMFAWSAMTAVELGLKRSADAWDFHELVVSKNCYEQCFLLRRRGYEAGDACCDFV